MFLGRQFDHAAKLLTSVLLSRLAPAAVDQDNAPPAFYLGSTWILEHTKCAFAMAIQGKRVQIAQVPRAEAAAGARLYDAAQIVINGAHAKTNFSLDGFAADEIAAVISLLRGKGVDVRRAVDDMRQAHADAPWLGVGPGVPSEAGTSYTAQLAFHAYDSSKVITLEWSALGSADAAARQVDCGILALQGPDCRTNFPASECSAEAIAEAGTYAVLKGVPRARVEANLAAVEQVRGELLVSGACQLVQRAQLGHARCMECSRKWYELISNSCPAHIRSKAQLHARLVT
jgi:hypothetical protein